MAGSLGAIIISMLAGSSMSMFSSSTASVACIDDSDCTSLGHKYACYFYQCINYMDKEPSIEHCDKEDQCKDAMECYRYKDMCRMCISTVSLMQTTPAP